MSDLDRNSWCILGLLFDVTDTDKTIKYLFKSVQDNHKIVVCTPNINYITLSLKDAVFRESSLNCNLSLADGMPIIWIAKILNIPLLSRVSGSGLIQDMCSQKLNSKISLFLFGGEDGIAKLAAKNVNKMNGMLEANGFLSPGYVSVKEMSKDNVISDINKYNSDFLLVALGAKKGQEWIDLNKNKLNSKIISHLGATINFLAGSVKRAPIWMQKTGLEWLWRIIEEPSLWFRYFQDGLQLIKLLITRIMPYWWFLNFHKKEVRKLDIKELKIIEDEDNIFIKFDDVITINQISEIRPFFKEILLNKKNVYIDLLDVKYIDSAFIAFLILFRQSVMKNGFNFKVDKSNLKIDKIIYYNCAEFIMDF